MFQKCFCLAVMTAVLVSGAFQLALAKTCEECTDEYLACMAGSPPTPLYCNLQYNQCQNQWCP